MCSVSYPVNLRFAARFLQAKGQIHRIKCRHDRDECQTAEALRDFMGSTMLY